MTISSDPVGTLKKVQAAIDSASRDSLRLFLDKLVVDRVPEPMRFELIREPWQMKLLEPMIPVVESVAGLRDYRGPRSFWRTLCRGHNKTTSIAWLCCWLLAYSRRPLEMTAAAADSQQAGLVYKSMQRVAELNPWLGERLAFKQNLVLGPQTNSELQILASDTKSAYGGRYDLILCDELTHWQNSNMWNALLSGRMKRTSADGTQGPVFIVITNAGYTGSWQHDMLEAAKRDHAQWDVYDREGFLANWVDKAVLASDRAKLVPGEARRLFDNAWVAAGEGGYITESEARACEDSSLSPQWRGQPGVQYVASIDYGSKKDKTALTVIHQRSDGIVVVDRQDVWQCENPGEPVPVGRVEAWVEEIARSFNRPLFVVDPWQMEGSIQRWEQYLNVVRFEYQGGKANYRLAEAVRTAVVSGRLKWYPGCGRLRHRDGTDSTLTSEMASVTIQPTQYGYRISHEASGHDDRVISLGMGLLSALQMPGQALPPPLVVSTPLSRDHAGIPGGIDVDRRRTVGGLTGGGSHSLSGLFPGGRGQ